MNPARILTVCMAAMLVAGGAALAADLPAAVVRVQQAPAIDGDGRDWAGIRAEQEIALPGQSKPVARFKLAWDDKAFYILVTVKDDSPMKNGSTVFQELLKGGDAIGVCLGTADGTPAPQRIMLALVNGKPEVLAMRPQWPDKAHPYTYFTQAAGKVPMDFVWHLPDAALAVKTARGGYTVEAAIPVSVLGIKPAAGLLLNFDVQVIFSDAAGSLNADTAWWHSTGNGPMCTVDIATEARLYPEAWGTARLYVADPGPRGRIESASAKGQQGVPIAFKLPRDAKVTLNIMDDTGWVVRELLRVEPMSEGEHTVYWDGRDRWGSPMPAGKYRWRMAYLDGIKTTFAASVGNSGRPPYRTPDGFGSIGGVHNGPAAVAADSEGIYMLNSGEEGQKSLRKIDPATGKAFWFASCGVFGGGHAMAADGAFAYMVYSGAYSKGTRLMRLDAKTGRNAPIGQKNEPLALGLGEKPVAGLAIAAGKAYFSVTADNRIGVVDLATGEPGKDVSVPAPSGLCKLGDTALLVCSQTQVLKLSLETGQAAALITGLAAPRAVAVDAGGTIYVSDLDTSQQIKKFSADGKLLAAIGKPGGRALNVSKYDPLEFRNVSGLAIGPDGNLWLVEYFQPRRYAKLTLDGKWLEDFYGPNNGGFIVDLDDPSTLYFGSQVWMEEGRLKWVKAKIDYKTYAESPDPSKGFKVEAIHTLSPNGSDYSAKPDLFTAEGGPGLGVWGETLRSYIFTATNGKRYLWRTSGLWLWSDARWKPAAIVGAKDAPFWSDANGDGLVQPEEIGKDTIPIKSIHYIDRDLTLYGTEGTLTPAKVDARGVPSYAGGTFTPFFKDEKPPLLHFIFDNTAFSPAGVVPGKPDSEGSLYYTVELEPPSSQGFWDRYSEGRIVKVKDGKVQWIVGHHSEHGEPGRDGDTIRLTAMTGEADGVVLFADVNAQFIAYTTDGLCLGWALNDGQGRRAGADVGGSAANGIYIENMATGEFFKDPRTGKRLLVSWTTEDIRVLEVSGAFGKDITRVDGSVSLPTAMPRSASLPGQCSIPDSSWVKLNKFNPYLDGYDAEWAASLPAISFRKGKELVADLRLRRDAGSLCVFADVLCDPVFPPAEGMPPADLFGKAQGLELLIGPPAPDRTAAAAGDTRIFITATREKDGWLKGRALAYRPASGPLQPSPELRQQDTFGAYVGNPPAAPIDFSGGLTEIPGTHVKVKERQDRRGFRIEAEIPLALLPEITKTVPVTFSRSSADRNSLKAISDTRSDLAGPARFSAAVHIASGNEVRRVAWMDDGERAADPTAMNPSKWGWANVQVELTW